MSRSLVLLLITVMLSSSLVMVGPVFAESTLKPSVPEFTLKYVDYSYDIPPKTTSTIDPYTNETITTTIPGRHVENKTIEVTIINNIDASYYNFRYKGHYENEWRYYPFNPNNSLPYFLSDSFSVPYKASNSSYTVAALPSYFFKDIRVGGEVDVQVQALFGDFRAEPFGHILPIEPTYDFYFEGTTNGWSETQTIEIADSESSSPEPTIPTSPTQMPDEEPELSEQSVILGVAVTVAIVGAGLGLLIYLIKRK